MATGSMSIIMEIPMRVNGRMIKRKDTAHSAQTIGLKFMKDTGLMESNQVKESTSGKMVIVSKAASPTDPKVVTGWDLSKMGLEFKAIGTTMISEA